MLAVTIIIIIMQLFRLTLSLGQGEEKAGEKLNETSPSIKPGFYVFLRHGRRK